MPAIQVFNGTTDISAGIDWRSLQMTAVVTKERGNLKFDITNVNNPLVPSLGDTIYLKYNGVRLFGGTCTERQTVVVGGVLQRYSITCMDWGFAFDSQVVHKTYQNMEPSDIVKDIMANFAAAGFTSNNVQKGNFLVASMKFNYEQATRAIESLAKQIGWDWYIDPNKDVHFFFATTNTGSSELNPAPFNIDESTGKILWPTLDVDVSIANLKNSIYVIGGTMFRPSTTTDTPDVYTTTAGRFVYPIAYPYETTKYQATWGAAATIRVTVDNVAQSIGLDGQDDPTIVNVLYNAGSSGGAQGGAPFIRFTSDPGSGHTLKVFGNAQLSVVAHLTSPSSILAYGKYEDTIIDKQIKSVREAQARANAELIQFDHPVYHVKFSTIVPGLAIGQTIFLNSALLGITKYQLLIRRIEAVGYSPTELMFNVEAFGSDNVTFTDIMMTLLQESLSQNATPDNTILQEVIPIAETLKITDIVILSGTVAPYAWQPVASPLQVAEGGGSYGSFGLGSVAYGGGLPYPNDAPTSTSLPPARWGFATWR